MYAKNSESERKTAEILQILSQYNEPIGALTIARELEKTGISIGERGVRYYLEVLDEHGLTKKHSNLGRTLTEKGKEELKNTLVFDRVGFVISKISSMAYQTTFNPYTFEGKIIVNLSYIDKNKIDEALDIIKEVFNVGLCVAPYIKIFEEGEEFKTTIVSKGKVGLATTCSITVDGVLLKAGIPTDPKYGGTVQMRPVKEGDMMMIEALRFTDLIAYEGSSLDPLEVFMARGMTSVNEVISGGHGKILANFREIPAIAKESVEDILERLEKVNFIPALQVGEVNRPLLSVPVDRDRFGMAIVGGINAMAAIEEKGIKTETNAITDLIEIKKMETIL